MPRSIPRFSCLSIHCVLEIASLSSLRHVSMTLLALLESFPRLERTGGTCISLA